jgi:defect-in-organelle-trafficking protein DotC
MRRGRCFWLLAGTLLSGCATLPKTSPVVLSPGVADTDRALSKAIASVDAVMAQLNPYAATRASVPDRYVPAALLRPYDVNIADTPIEQVAATLARAAGYHLDVVNPDSVPSVPITLRENRKTLADLFRDLGTQGGTQADVILNADTRTVRLAYHKDGTAAVRATPVGDGVATSQPSYAQITPSPVPPSGYSPDAPAALANPENSPVDGASIEGVPFGKTAPPSLELLMSLRPGTEPQSGLSSDRAAQLREAALAYGTAGGLAAEAFKINENLRRRQDELDRTFNDRFRELVLPASDGSQVLIVPPALSEAQLALAVADNGLSAREDNRIYRISQNAKLASRPPLWEGFLVANYDSPNPPPDVSRPHNDTEAAFWKQCVAQGWVRGEKQGVEIFLDLLAVMQSQIEGMARYRVLLASGLVQPPRVAIIKAVHKGRGDAVWYGDVVTNITGGASLNGGPVRKPQPMPYGPIAPIPGPGVQDIGQFNGERY